MDVVSIVGTWAKWPFAGPLLSERGIFVGRVRSTRYHAMLEALPRRPSGGQSPAQLRTLHNSSHTRRNAVCYFSNVVPSLTTSVASVITT